MDIYVGNLPYTYGNEELEALFAPYGPVASARVITDRETGRSRGFGFVEMSDKAQAEESIRTLNGKDVNGRALTVNESKPKEGGRPMGGGGGGGARSSGGGGMGGGGRRW